MPLIRDTGVSAHDWRKAEPDEALGQLSFVIAPFDRLDEVLDGDGRRPIAIALPNTVDVAALTPHLSAFALVTVAFGSFADGRGFSVARRLRAAGYAGELWASGHLIPDQYAFARSCGFDAVLVDEQVFARQGEIDWCRAAGSLSLAYQGAGADYPAGPKSILELRRAARARRAAA